MPGAAVAPPSGSLLLRQHDRSGRRSLRPEIVDRVETRAQGPKHPALRHAPATGQGRGGYVVDAQPCHSAYARVNRPTAKQYGAKAKKRPRRSIATRNRIAKTPERNATMQPTISGTTPIWAMSTDAWRASSKPAPAISGIAIRKLKSAAGTAPRPTHSPDAIVLPERDTPGNGANACARPMMSAPAGVGCAESSEPLFLVDHKSAPVTRNPTPAAHSESNARSMRCSRNTPTSPAGIMAMISRPA